MSNPKTAYYASVGPRLKLFEVDVDGAQLHEREAVSVPANIQYAWPHPSRRYLHVVSSKGGPPALPSRPIHASLDRSGGYLLTAYNDPSGLTVHRIGSDGAIGAPIAQPQDLDT